MIWKYHNHKLQTTHDTARKSRTTITIHKEDKLSKATSSLFPIQMIANKEWTYKNKETITESDIGSYNQQRMKNNRTTSLERTAAYVTGGGGGGGQGVLWYFHTCVGSGYFLGVQNSEFQYFLGFSEKWIFLGGYEDFVDIFGESAQNWASYSF